MTARRKRSLSPVQSKQRAEFRHLMKRVERLFKWLGVRAAKTNRALIVDLPDFHMKCAEFQERIRQLARTPLTEKNRLIIEQRLLTLMTEAEQLAIWQEQLAAPLERMWLAVKRKNERMGIRGKRIR